jgi:hypothetical protein
MLQDTHLGEEMIFARGMHIRYELKAIIVSLDGDKEESY